MRRIADMPPDTSHYRKMGHGLKRTKGTTKPDNTKAIEKLRKLLQRPNFS